MSKIYTSADQLIGHTPLLELTHIEAAEGLEAKLLAKLEANKKKPQKKSGFMKRLEEAQRMQQEQLKKQQDQKKKR